nr:DUF3298 and DUF4163 domain-containing protein [Salirhabdus salicampi]
MIVKVMLCLLIVLSFNNPFIFAQQIEVVNQKMTEVQMEVHEVREIKHNYRIDMNIPEFKGMEDTFFQMKLNYYLKKVADEQKEKFLNDIKELSKTNENTKNSSPNRLTVEPVLVANGTVVSVRTTIYKRLGDEEEEKVRTLNILNEEKAKPLRLKDLFKKGVPYKSMISSKIQEEMVHKKREGMQFFEGKKEFTTIDKKQPFYIKNEKLVIVFDAGEIAPQSAGTVFFPLSIADLKDKLKKNIYQSLM